MTRSAPRRTTSHPPPAVAASQACAYLRTLTSDRAAASPPEAIDAVVTSDRAAISSPLPLASRKARLIVSQKPPRFCSDIPYPWVRSGLPDWPNQPAAIRYHEIGLLAVLGRTWSSRVTKTRALCSDRGSDRIDSDRRAKPAQQSQQVARTPAFSWHYYSARTRRLPVQPAEPSARPSIRARLDGVEQADFAGDASPCMSYRT